MKLHRRKKDKDEPQEEEKESEADKAFLLEKEGKNSCKEKRMQNEKSQGKKEWKHFQSKWG